MTRNGNESKGRSPGAELRPRVRVTRRRWAKAMTRLEREQPELAEHLFAICEAMAAARVQR